MTGGHICRLACMLFLCVLKCIVCMLELPMPAQGLDRCMTIFTCVLMSDLENLCFL